jgi:hypothetical protein
MTDMATNYGPGLEESRETSPVTSVPASTETDALITEQQVLLSTAAAVALPPAKTGRWSDAVHAVVGSVRTWLVSAAKPPAKPVYPKRHAWLDNALMSREMDRL